MDGRATRLWPLLQCVCAARLAGNDCARERRAGMGVCASGLNPSRHGTDWGGGGAPGAVKAAAQVGLYSFSYFGWVTLSMWPSGWQRRCGVLGGELGAVGSNGCVELCFLAASNGSPTRPGGRKPVSGYNPKVLHGARRTPAVVPAAGASKTMACFALGHIQGKT